MNHLIRLHQLRNPLSGLLLPGLLVAFAMVMLAILGEASEERELESLKWSYLQSADTVLRSGAQELEKLIEEHLVPAPGFMPLPDLLVCSLELPLPAGGRETAEQSLLERTLNHERLPEAGSMRGLLVSRPDGERLVFARQLAGRVTAVEIHREVLGGLALDRVYERLGGPPELELRLRAAAAAPVSRNFLKEISLEPIVPNHVPELRIRGERALSDIIWVRNFRGRMERGATGLLGIAGICLCLWQASRERAQALKSQSLIWSFSHEVKTPLAIIRMYAERLKVAANPEARSVHASSDIIINQVSQLANKVDFMLATEKSGAGERQQGFFWTQPAAVLQAAVDAAGEPALARRVHLDVQNRSSFPTAFLNPSALQTAIENVVLNAVKFSPVGGTVSVDAELVAGELRVMVLDAGIGIQPDELDRLGEPFFRGRASAGVSGSGIGMGIVLSVLKNHGGRLEVSSRPGSGSLVSLIVPLVLEGEHGADPDRGG